MRYTREELDKLNYHVLRNLAREVGVRAPTSFAKGKLIDEILLIESGKKEPFKGTSKGRPVKKNTIDKISLEQISVSIEKEKIKTEIIETLSKEIEKQLHEILKNV